MYDQTGQEIASMVGDTNLFLQDKGEEEGEDVLQVQVAEAEIMIAEEGARGKGMGWEAMCIMLWYGAKKLGINLFEAKIKVSKCSAQFLFLLLLRQVLLFTRCLC